MFRYLLFSLSFLIFCAKVDAKQFISLKSSKVNMRVGPGDEFPVSWVFVRSGLPLMLMAEFQQWRKVKYLDGTEGWIHQNMLSGRNTAVVTKDVALLFKNNTESRPIARIEKNVLVKVLKVENTWIKVDINKFKGWMKNTDLWGVNEEKNS